MIYPAHTLLGPNVIPYTNAGASLSPAAAAAAHYSNAYDFNPYSQAQLDPFQYSANNQAVVAAAAAASNPNVANYAYAALAQQAIAAGAPSLTTNYQQ